MVTTTKLDLETCHKICHKILKRESPPCHKISQNTTTTDDCTINDFIPLGTYQSTTRVNDSTINNRSNKISTSTTTINKISTSIPYHTFNNFKNTNNKGFGSRVKCSNNNVDVDFGIEPGPISKSQFLTAISLSTSQSMTRINDCTINESISTTKINDSKINRDT